YAALAAETTLAFTTREGVHITLSAICNSAIAAGHLKYNPCFHSFSYAAQPEPSPILTTQQVKQFLACLAEEHPKHRLYYTLLIATGLRRAECLALQWQDINWQTKSLTVAHRVAAVRGEAARLLPVKPVSATLSAPLAQALNAYQITQNKEDGFIFAQPNGAPMMPSSFTYRLRLIRQKHGVAHITTDSLYRYHQAMRRQMSLAKLQKKLGV
ncbi:MAG: tyrosine-type recombinase/integrase, partial [Faecalibacterium sp.]